MIAYRFLTAAFLRTTLPLYLGLASLYYVIDLTERLRLFARYDAGVGASALYTALRLPLILVQLAPAAALLGVLLAFFVLARRHELPALRAGGRGLPTLVGPIATVALGLTLWVLAVQERMMPAASEAALQLKQQVRGEPVSRRPEGFWHRDGRRHAHVGRFYPGEALAENLRLFELDAEGRLVRWERVDRAVRRGDPWIFESIERRTGLDGAPTLERVPREERAFIRSLAGLPRADYLPEAMNREQLDRRIEDMEARGMDGRRYRTDRAAKDAQAVLTFLIAFLALPFGLQPMRAAGFTAAAAACAALGFGLWALSDFGTTMGREGLWPPLAAAWMPTAMAVLLTAALGVWRLRRSGWI